MESCSSPAGGGSSFESETDNEWFLKVLSPWEPYYHKREIRAIRAARGLIVDIPLSEIGEVDKSGATNVLKMVDKKPFWPHPATNEKIITMAETGDDSLLGDMVDYLKERIFFINDDEYHSLASWIIATYLKECFSYAPRWYLFGGRDSGKSTCQYWMRLLVYRGIKTVNMTPAVFYRMMDKYGPTLFRDESQDEKGELADMVDQIEKAGFEKDNVIPRCSLSDPDEIDAFDPFGFLVRSYRDERPKNDTLSRGFCAVMVNKPDEYYTKDRTEGINEAARLRARLIAFRMNTLTGNIDIRRFAERAKITGRGRFGNRALDVTVPVLSVALMFGCENQVLKTVARAIRNLDDSTSSEPGAMVFYAIQRVYSRQPKIFEKGTFDLDGKERRYDHRDISKMFTNDIIRQFNETLEQDAIDAGTAEIVRYRRVEDHGTNERVEVPEYRVPKMSGQRITAIMKNLGFILSDEKKKARKRTLDPKTFYVIYERLLARYGEAE